MVNVLEKYFIIKVKIKDIVKDEDCLNNKFVSRKDNYE